MESFVVTWRELLIAAILILAVYIAEMLLLMYASKSRGFRLWQRGAAASSQSREIEVLQAEMAQLREQIARLQDNLEQIKAASNAATPYGQAMQMAQQGLDPGEVAASCGISRAEAELIVALQRAK